MLPRRDLLTFQEAMLPVLIPHLLNPLPPFAWIISWRLPHVNNWTSANQTAEK